MRISDWSSDVCSSDLRPASPSCSVRSAVRWPPFRIGAMLPVQSQLSRWRRYPAQPRQVAPAPAEEPRSEEHTSELQSLMRSSYAVFCLKKQKSRLRIIDKIAKAKT